MAEPEYNMAMFCSHIRAVHIFLETLFNELAPNKCKFIAYKCRNGLQSFENGQCFPRIEEQSESLSINEKLRGDVGIFAEKSVGNGVMYFTTRDSRPLCGTTISCSKTETYNPHINKSSSRNSAASFDQSGAIKSPY